MARPVWGQDVTVEHGGPAAANQCLQGAQLSITTLLPNTRGMATTSMGMRTATMKAMVTSTGTATSAGRSLWQLVSRRLRL